MSKFSNSPLVSHIVISPNKTTNRNHSIDTITIHCTASECPGDYLYNRMREIATKVNMLLS